MLTRIALSLAALLLLGGCDPAQLYANANAESMRLWTGLVAYDMEQWEVRRDARRGCRENVIDPAVEKLNERGCYKEATELYRANYPPVTYIQILDDAERDQLLQTLQTMPACTWPEGLDPDTCGTAAVDAPIPITP